MEKNNCIFCEGEGIIYAANGPDDCQPEYCSVCLDGRKLKFFAWFREAKAAVVKAKTV